MTYNTQRHYVKENNTGKRNKIVLRKYKVNTALQNMLQTHIILPTYIYRENKPIIANLHTSISLKRFMVVI